MYYLKHVLLLLHLLHIFIRFVLAVLFYFCFFFANQSLLVPFWKSSEVFLTKLLILGQWKWKILQNILNWLEWLLTMRNKNNRYFSVHYVTVFSTHRLMKLLLSSPIKTCWFCTFTSGIYNIVINIPILFTIISVIGLHILSPLFYLAWSSFKPIGFTRILSMLYVFWFTTQKQW